MFCSIVIATLARATLERAVQSALQQTPPGRGFEVIVVNDSGRPLPPSTWQDAEAVRVITTQRRERSMARNVGAAVARGDYLLFLDDDDWLLPSALVSLEALAQTDSSAAWLYGRTQLFDRRERPLVVLDHQLSGNCFIQLIAGEWIPMTASLIKISAFFAVGGFHPLVVATEDVDLARRIGRTGTFAGTQALIAGAVVGRENSSTDYDQAASFGRWTREMILDEAGVFGRMRASASSSYWSGRIVRAYLTSALWNLRRRKVFRAASRAGYCLAGLVLAGRHWPAADFWRAILRPYASFTFARALEQARQAS